MTSCCDTSHSIYFPEIPGGAVSGDTRRSCFRVRAVISVMTQSSSVIDQPYDEMWHAESVGFHVALLVRNECIRHGLTAMLSSLAIVRGVHIWDPAHQPAGSPPHPDFDIFILQYGDLDIQVTDRFARDIAKRGKKLLFLLSRDHEDSLDMISAIPSDGFLVQDDLTSSALATTISRVTDGETPIPAMLANRLLARAREGALRQPPVGSNLTPRERQVLELLVEGLSNKQIARRLLISQHGVKRLVSNVLAKLNCPNRTQAVAVALTDGLIAAD